MVPSRVENLREYRWRRALLYYSWFSGNQVPRFADGDGSRTAETRWLCRLLAPLALFLPLFFLSRVMFLGNRDALFYGNVPALTSDALRGGHFFTRWFADANASMGSAVMMFYPPLAYIATALFELPLAGLHLNPDTRFILGIYASQVLCGVTAFAWLKRDFRIRTAFIGSLLYVLLPYKFVYIYMHFNLAQLWALAFLPLWMLGVEKPVAGDGARAAAIFALRGAATYYSHPPTVVAFGVVPVCYTLWFARRQVGVWDWLALACGLMACSHRNALKGVFIRVTAAMIDAQNRLGSALPLFLIGWQRVAAQPTSAAIIP